LGLGIEICKDAETYTERSGLLTPAAFNLNASVSCAQVRALKASVRRKNAATIAYLGSRKIGLSSLGRSKWKLQCNVLSDSKAFRPLQ
jgi:hypothetical protein